MQPIHRQGKSLFRRLDWGIGDFLGMKEHQIGGIGNFFGYKRTPLPSSASSWPSLDFLHRFIVKICII